MKGGELKNIRLLKRMSQTKFAELLDVSRSSVVKWEVEGVPEEKEIWIRGILGKQKNIVNEGPTKYNKQTLEKFGVSFTIKEIALFVAQNQEVFMKEKVISNMIDAKAMEKARELLLLLNIKKFQ